MGTGLRRAGFGALVVALLLGACGELPTSSASPDRQLGTISFATATFGGERVAIPADFTAIVAVRDHGEELEPRTVRSSSLDEEMRIHESTLVFVGQRLVHSEYAVNGTRRVTVERRWERSEDGWKLAGIHGTLMADDGETVLLTVDLEPGEGPGLATRALGFIGRLVGPRPVYAASCASLRFQKAAYGAIMIGAAATGNLLAAAGALVALVAVEDEGIRQGCWTLAQ